MASTVWKGQLTFGLVTFPVRLIRAARKERIPMKYVSRAEPAEPEPESEAEAAPSAPVAPVRQAYVPEGESAPVGAGELDRGYEVAPDEFVVVRNEELKKLRLPTSPDLQILRAVKMEEIDPVFLETSYYAHPGKGGEGPYALFYEALKDTEYAALGQLAMHGRQHVLVVRAGAKGLIAHTMFYVNEVRGADEYETETAKVNPKELDLAKRLVDAIAGEFQAEEFTDTYRDQLRALIESKSPVPKKEVEERKAPGKVVDLMDALRRSLEDVKPKAAPAARKRKAS